MDANTAGMIVRTCLGEMQRRLDQAASIAKAGQACADAGNLDKGIEIALDVEPLVHEVKTLLNAATLISRISDP